MERRIYSACQLLHKFKIKIFVGGEFMKNSIKNIAVCAFPLLVCATSAHALDVKISGYAKLDMTYDADQRQGDFAYAGGLNTGAAADTAEGGFNAHARESRIRFDAVHNDYKVVAEGDFFGNGGNEFVSNSNNFRIRSFYGQSGNWLAGQTWSTFMDFMNWPGTLDFAGTPGQSFIRQGQLRYSSGGLSVALENPQAGIRDLAGETITSTDPLPDLVVKYRKEGDRFGFYAAGLVKNVEADLGADTVSTTASALHAGAVLKTGSGGRLGLSFIAGSPGRYQQDKFFFPDFLLVNGDVEAIDSTAVQFTYNQPLSNGSMNFTYAKLDIDDEFASGIATIGGFETASEVSINRVWSAGENVSYGLELGYGEREDFSGETGDNTRLQFSAKYKF